MKCEFYDNKGYLLLDETQKEQHQEIIKHIKACPECSRKWQSDQEIIDMFQTHAHDLEVEPSPALMQRTKNSLFHRSIRYSWKIYVAAAAVILLVFIFITYHEKIRTPIPDEHLAWDNSINSTIESLDARINELKQKDTFSGSSSMYTGCFSKGVTSHIENNICTIDASIKTLSH